MTTGSSSGAAWRRGWPGILVTAAIGLFAVGGSLLARRIGSPATTRAFGSAAAVVFIAALACSVVAIFGPNGLPDAEVAYVVIWLTFLVMYRLGMSRWQHWDRLERQIACETVAERAVNRWPAYLTSLALVLATAAARLRSWAGRSGPTSWSRCSSLPSALAGAGYIIGTAASRGRRDPIAAPDPVETATSF